MNPSLNLFLQILQLLDPGPELIGTIAAEGVRFALATIKDPQAVKDTVVAMGPSLDVLNKWYAAHKV